MKMVVSHINFYDNVIEMKQVSASTWKDALIQFISKDCKTEEDKKGVIDFVNSLPNDMEEARKEYFNTDCEFNILVVE